MRRSTIHLTGLLMLLASVVSLSAADTAFVFVHENVLGTTLELQIVADQEVNAKAADKVALAEIERLSRIFSTYDPDSEFSRWQANSEGAKSEGAKSEGYVPISSDLLALLQVSDRWQAATQSAYHPGSERLFRIWKQAESKNRIPSEGDLWGAVIDLKAAPWELDVARSSARRSSRYPLSLNAIATGYMVDQVAQRLRERPGISGVVVNIGGDVRIAGIVGKKCPVPIRDPFANADGAAPFVTLNLGDCGVTTSGSYQRGFTINDRHFSHILDPRSGKSANRIISSTVVAPSAVDADALATAFSVLPPEDSLKLVKSLRNVECLLIDRDRTTFKSEGWQALEARSTGRSPSNVPPGNDGHDKNGWNGGFEFAVTFEIRQPEENVRYRRPYVAVWIEDADGFPIRTLVLWVQTSGSGPRWIPDLKRWYRSDRTRKLVDDTDLVPTVSEPTRKPGAYTVVWDGVDDHGQRVKPGEYTLQIEAAREHGTYQLIRSKVAFGETPFQIQLKGNQEIRSAAVDYRRRKTTSEPTASKKRAP